MTLLLLSRGEESEERSYPWQWETNVLWIFCKALKQRAQQKFTVQGGKEEKKPLFYYFWEVFLSCLVTVHNRAVLWASWAARSGCGRGTGHLPGQGRRGNHGTWPTPAPGAPAQPGSQRTSGDACLRDSRRLSLGALPARGLEKHKEPHCHPTQVSLSHQQSTKTGEQLQYLKPTDETKRKITCLYLYELGVYDKTQQVQTPAFCQVQH